MVIVPQEYKLGRDEPRVTFKNFYIEYGRFHNDETNMWIHLVFIPLIVMCLFGCFYCSPNLRHFKFAWKEEVSFAIGDYTARESNQVEGEFVVRATTAAWLLICSFYLWTDLICGSVAMLGGIALCKTACVISDLDAEEGLLGGQAFWFWLGVQVFGWITQFVGHGVFEQRAPAILTNLLFLFLAPFFVAFEVLNMVFGYK